MVAVLLGPNHFFLVGSPTAPLASVKRFYNAVTHSDFDRAYKTLHPTLQGELSAQQFRALAEANGGLFYGGYYLWTTVESEESVLIQGDITSRDHETVVARFWLLKDNGSWQISGYRIEGASGSSMSSGRTFQDPGSQ